MGRDSVVPSIWDCHFDTTMVGSRDSTRVRVDRVDCVVPLVQSPLPYLSSSIAYVEARNSLESARVRRSTHPHTFTSWQLFDKSPCVRFYCLYCRGSTRCCANNFSYGLVISHPFIFFIVGFIDCDPGRCLRARIQTPSGGVGW